MASVRCQVPINCMQNLPLLSDRLPESSAKGFQRQLSKFQRGATWFNWSHCVLLQWMEQWVSAARRVVPTRLCGSWKKAFQKTWPYCRNGHHFTVQHLRFSVEESASLALLETVSGGLLWSVKPEEQTQRAAFQTFPHVSSPQPEMAALYS